MKRFICLVLSIVFCAITLVGCMNDEIGEDLDKYKEKYHPEVVEELELDFYIVVGEGTTANAISTVGLMVNQHLEKFKTKLDIHYLSADEYAEKMTSDLALEGDDRADIVLITSKDMFDELYSEHAIANITEYYNPATSVYKSLNTKICSAILQAVTVEEIAYTVAGNEYTSYNKYCVPNNHIVSHYELAVISTKAAEYYNIGSEVVATMIDEESCKPLYDAIDSDPKHTYTKEASVRFITDGTYADIAKYEAEGCAVNIVKYPEVTKEEAYSSAFAIARHPLDLRHQLGKGEEELKENKEAYSDYYNRCMQVIFELNSNVEFRNLLQYGKLGTNYKLDENGNVTHDDIAPEDVYVMDLLHTGDVFLAYYCDCDLHKWTKEVAEYGTVQNLEAIVPAPALPEGDTENNE